MVYGVTTSLDSTQATKVVPPAPPVTPSPAMEMAVGELAALKERLVPEAYKVPGVSWLGSTEARGSTVPLLSFWLPLRYTTLVSAAAPVPLVLT